MPEDYQNNDAEINQSVTKGENPMFYWKLRFLTSVAVVGICMMITASTSFADSLAVSIDIGALTINEDQTDARLLLSIDIPEELTNAELTFAELVIPLRGVIPDSTVLTVYCHPLMVPWNAETVTWEDLGDSLTPEVISEDGTHYATVDQDEQDAYFDITSMVGSWIGGTAENYGLLLFCDTERLPRFVFSRRDDRALGRVEFTYTH
jgi:hypothetical protein